MIFATEKERITESSFNILNVALIINILQIKTAQADQSQFLLYPCGIFVAAVAQMCNLRLSAQL